jgi:hypothetical protein
MRFQASWNDSIGFLKNTFEVSFFKGTEWDLLAEFLFRGQTPLPPRRGNVKCCLLKRTQLSSPF